MGQLLGTELMRVPLDGRAGQKVQAEDDNPQECTAASLRANPSDDGAVSGVWVQVVDVTSNDSG